MKYQAQTTIRICISGMVIFLFTAANCHFLGTEKKDMENKKILVKSLSNLNLQHINMDSSYFDYDDSNFRTIELSLTDGERLYVGKLVKNIPFDPTVPDRYCLEDDNLWLGASSRLGRINIFSEKEIPANYNGQTVVVSAKKKRSMDEKIKLGGPCTQKNEILQFRDDWYSDEGGSFTTHQKLKEAEYLEVNEILPIQLLRLPQPLELPRKGKLKEDHNQDKTIGKALEIVVFNPFSIKLDKLQVVVHYEGGPLKETPVYKAIMVSLEPWESKKITVAREIEEEWKKGKYSNWYYIDAYIIDQKNDIEFLGPSQYAIEPIQY